MHAQTIDGSRQMQQTVVRLYVSFISRRGGPSINDVENLEGEESNYTLRCIWMHAQAIDGSRQMWQYILYGLFFSRRGGPSINDIENLEGKGQLRYIWMHTQAIDGSRQMQQTIRWQYILYGLFISRRRGPSINDVENFEGEGSIEIHLDAYPGHKRVLLRQLFPY